MRLSARAAQVALRAIKVAVAASGIAEPHQTTAAFYLLVTVFNVKMSVVAEAARCSRQNVSQVLQRVEDRRDDEDFNAALARLEARLMGEW